MLFSLRLEDSRLGKNSSFSLAPACNIRIRPKIHISYYHTITINIQALVNKKTKPKQATYFKNVQNPNFPYLDRC